MGLACLWELEGNGDAGRGHACAGDLDSPLIIEACQHSQKRVVVAVTCNLFTLNDRDGLDLPPNFEYSAGERMHLRDLALNNLMGMRNRNVRLSGMFSRLLPQAYMEGEEEGEEVGEEAGGRTGHGLLVEDGVGVADGRAEGVVRVLELGVQRPRRLAVERLHVNGLHLRGRRALAQGWTPRGGGRGAVEHSQEAVAQA